MGKGATGKEPTRAGKIIRKTVGKVIDTGKIGVRGKSQLYRRARNKALAKKLYDKLIADGERKRADQLLRIGYTEWKRREKNKLDPMTGKPYEARKDMYVKKRK